MKKKKIFIPIIIISILIIIGICIFFIFNSDNKNKNNTNNEKEEFSYTPPLYKVCDSDSCIYILGTMHLGDNKIKKISKKTLDAYNSVDKLAVELDITVNNQINVFDFIYNDGTTIEDIASNELIKKLKNFEQKNSMFVYDTYKYFKVGYLDNLISTLIYIDIGLTRDGVDTILLEKAHDDKKEIIELETMEQQLSLLVEFSDEYYLNNIEYTLDNYDDLKKEINEMYEAYIGNDIDKLTEFINSEMSNQNEEDFINKMYTERNNEMTKKAIEYLKNNDNTMIAVGAAHVIGKDGIIEQLKNNYTVEIIK